MSAEFVACMEDVLDLYAEPYDPERPVVCFDETSKQLLAEKRSPIKPARRERYDYEYQRNGTRNLFMLCEPLAGWRHVAERRTMVDFAQQMRPRRSGWCWTTSTPTNQLPSTKPSSPRRLGEYANAWSFTTLPSTVVGWQRSSSVSWPGESCAGVHVHSRG